jgi:hypothetical protein
MLTPALSCRHITGLIPSLEQAFISVWAGKHDIHSTPSFFRRLAINSSPFITISSTFLITFMKSVFEQNLAYRVNGYIPWYLSIFLTNTG